MHTMDQHLADLVNAGQITHAAAMEKGHDLEALALLIQRNDPALTKADNVDYGDAFSQKPERR